VDAGVGGEFGVEGGCHGSSLADGDGVGTFGGNDFHAFAHVLDFRSADEHHFQWRCAELPFPNGAVDLPSVGVAADADIEGAEPGLRGILDFGGEQDGAGTGSEGGLGVDEVFKFGETFFAEKFEERAGLASGDDEAVDVIELLGLFDEHNLGAQLFKPAAVRVEIALQGQDTDDHGGCGSLELVPGATVRY
jgi:hypothetical protein